MSVSNAKAKSLYCALMQVPLSAVAAAAAMMAATGTAQETPQWCKRGALYRGSSLGKFQASGLVNDFPSVNWGEFQISRLGIGCPHDISRFPGLSGNSKLYGLSDWPVFPAQGLARFVSRAEMAQILGPNSVSFFGSFYPLDSNFGARANIFGTLCI